MMFLRLNFNNANRILTEKINTTQPELRNRKMKAMKKPARSGQMEKTLKMIAEIGKSMTIEELAAVSQQSQTK